MHIPQVSWETTTDGVLTDEDEQIMLTDGGKARLDAHRFWSLLSPHGSHERPGEPLSLEQRVFLAEGAEVILYEWRDLHDCQSSTP